VIGENNSEQMQVVMALIVATETGIILLGLTVI